MIRSTAQASGTVPQLHPADTREPVTTVDSLAPSEIVSTFFANYALPGPDAFKRAQRSLLSPGVQVDVNAVGEPQRYSGPEGYFQSLDDWGKLFRTGPDFSVEVDKSPTADGAWQAHLHGTLSLARDGRTITISPNQHRWTETFRIEGGRIAGLAVDMNLDPKVLASS